MKKTTMLIAILLSVFATAAVAQNLRQDPSIPVMRWPHWTGVWQGQLEGKPGVTITLADDSGQLVGTIVFNVINSKDHKILAVEPRTVLNPHVEGSALVFQVKRILKPHLEGEPESDWPDPFDIVDMSMARGPEGHATLICVKCGAASPTELVKAE